MSTVKNITEHRAENTKKGHVLAIKVFEEFLNYLNKDSSFTRCDENFLCNQQTIGEFADWMLSIYKPSEDSDDVVKAGTALQYLSGVKTLIKNKFPKNEIWSNEEWYSNIRGALEKLLNKSRMNLGLSVSDKAFPLSRLLISEICKHIYKRSEYLYLIINNPNYLLYILTMIYLNYN